VFANYDIEPVDIKINSQIHEYKQYCGTYEKKYKKNNEVKLLPATPDLCITDKWHWNNKEVEVNYKGVVEIKSPILDWITGIEPAKYKCKDEIKRHLNAEKNTKVILTDGITWVFYKKENGYNPINPPICIGELVFRCDNNGKMVRTGGRKLIVDDIKFGKEETFITLKEELNKFINPK